MIVTSGTWIRAGDLLVGDILFGVRESPWLSAHKWPALVVRVVHHITPDVAQSYVSCLSPSGSLFEARLSHELSVVVIR